ncbi:hypothetical protein RhiirA4_472368 [Rhizophagus irregularis]|uniref:Uncharacterized protein n=1 Tax=Rhizophagus irregularis TaxID=588596 RepID=A0A2I1H4W4_9GLOM|nr:hypothetical protein RhiirA4_472368 [Rhizophagus irregularis]
MSKTKAVTQEEVVLQLTQQYLLNSFSNLEDKTTVPRMFKDGQARPENLQFTVCFLVDYGASAFQKIFKNFLANNNELLTGECNNTIWKKKNYAE